MSECKFSEKLAELRVSKGFTQEDVAQGLSVSNKTVSKWETGASMPDLPMLVKLSRYFDVTTDVLLGLSEEKQKTTREEVCSYFKGLDGKQAVLKAFDAAKSVIPAIFGAVSEHLGDISDNEVILPSETPRFYRSQIKSHALYDFVASSDNVNIAVMMLRNKANFAWLKDKSKQTEIVKLFRFLSEEDVLSVLYFIHSTTCSDSFTADYIAQNTELDEQRVGEILDKLCCVGACHSVTAHLSKGEVKVYGCMGDGIILSLLSLAYEEMCGEEVYDFNYNGRCKMIGGKYDEFIV